MKKPNILLICVDQMRGDCMGNAGHPVVETPYLDTMAAKGVRFRRAYSAVPSCIASRAALMTGMSQERHGRLGYEDGVKWDYPHTLAGGLTEAGYHTQCIGKMHVDPMRYLCGFQNVVLHDGFLHYARKKDKPYREHQNNADDYFVWLKRKKGLDADLMDTGLDCNSWVARPWMYEEELHPTNWVVTESIDFLRRRDPTRPFFLMSSFVRPHAPLDPPEYYLRMYENKEMDEPKQGDWEEETTQSPVYNGASGVLPKAQQDRMKEGYYGCITHIDHQIGRLLAALEEERELENTIILFVSDHGELMGDHHLFRKALPYEGSANIPLLIYDPGNHLRLAAGSVVDGVAELRDILPTIYGIAGIEKPEECDGECLLPLARGEQAAWRHYIHGQHEYGALSNHYIVTSHDKYLYFENTGREQYFDLDKDPDEIHDAIGDEDCQQRINELRSIMKQYL